MEEIRKNIKEDAKSDWMNTVKKHKRKQKGLPALSSLNTNAGDVEKNVEIFNDMQPSTITSVSPVNGTPSESCCEDCNIKKFDDLDDKFDMSMRSLL